MESENYEDDKVSGAYTEVYVWGGKQIFYTINSITGDHHGQLGTHLLAGTLLDNIHPDCLCGR